MGRSTTYNNVYTPELWEKVNKENKALLTEFINYKRTSGKAETTTNQYFSVLRLFFIWNLQNNQDKFFTDVKKRDLVNFVSYMMFDLKASSNRIRTVRSIISSLGEYVENMSDEVEEWEGYRNIALKIDVPKVQKVRKNSVFEQEDIDKCLDKLIEDGNIQIACFMALAAASGARKAELLRFKCEYISDDKVVFDGDWEMYLTPEIETKGGKMLQKFVLKDQFKKYFDLWMKEREEKGITNEYIFVVKDKDNTWKEAQIHNADYWAEVIGKYMNCDFYFHSLRHFWTTSLKKKGVPDSAIQELQGWASIDMVSIYSDITKDNMLNGLFGNKGSLNNMKGDM